MNKLIASFATLFVLGAVNAAIYHKERHINNGTEVLLELAPVDPRSLMQGDYMILRLAIANDILSSIKSTQGEDEKSENHDGLVSVALSDQKVATFLALANDASPDAQLLKYRFRNGRLKFGTNAFFFEEGSAAAFDQARYGVFKVAADGDMILVDMADESFKRIKQGLLERSGHENNNAKNQF